MNGGYVYILINRAFDSMVKIGKTSRSSLVRARELFNTSLPYPFIVVFEIFSNNYSDLEKKIHERLAEYRVSNNREFFNYPIKDAIRLLIELNRIYKIDFIEDRYEAISIFEEMKSRFGSKLRSDIVSIKLVQVNE